MASELLEAAAAAAWAEALGCDTHVLSHPDARGRGFARRIASQMISDALPAAGIIRYRALTTDSPSLAIARTLGFAGCGHNLIARLPATGHR